MREIRAVGPPDAADDIIESHVAVHDSDHVEIKLEYPIPTDDDARYRIETFLFVPRALGIAPESYPAQQFYSDVNTYIRFATPDTPLRVLADSAGLASPLARIETLLERGERSAVAYSTELKLFACGARARLRDQTRVLCDRVDQPEVAAQVFADCSEFSGNIRYALERWRAVGQRLSASAGTVDAVRECFSLCDEFVSVNIDTRLCGLVAAFDRIRRTRTFEH